MPVAPIGHMNVAIRPLGVDDVVDLNARWKHIYDYRVVERNDACPELFPPCEFIALGIHGKEVAFHTNKRPLVAFHGSDEMAPGVVMKKLAMDNVNVFA
jgi:hypothetical protein